jgi:hypothetical protein
MLKHPTPVHLGTVDLPMADDFMANMLLYFRVTGDRESKVWVFRDDVPSKFLRTPFCAGLDDFRIEVLDLFRGRHPLLINYESLTTEIQLPFRPTAILDSNIVSYMHQYVTSDPLLTASRRKTVGELLRFLIKARLDYNPFFYYIEGSARNDLSSLRDYATPFSESILRLHTMDTAHFLATGQIKVDEEVLELYKNEFGASEFPELAAEHAKRMVRPVDFELEWRSKISYASLLKIALIHRSSSRGVVKKYEELRAFMEVTFNIAIGIERMLALHYFSGQFQNFIPIQKGANSERALKRVRAAAWDFLLLELPSFMLVQDPSDGICFGFPCTGDRALSSIGRACSIQAVMGFTPKANKPLPVLGYDLSILERDIGVDVVRRITDADFEWQCSRRERDLESETHISFEGLEELIEELEQQVIAYCKT